MDAVAALCEAGVLQDTGLIDEESHAFTAYVEECEGQPAFRLPGTAVRLTQKDIRAVQLAKSAICAGMRTLIAEAGLQAEAIAELVVAGGFGSRIDPVSAERIGLFPAGFAAKARAVGNAAGAGAAMVLLSSACLLYTSRNGICACLRNTTAPIGSTMAGSRPPISPRWR